MDAADSPATEPTASQAEPAPGGKAISPRPIKAISPRPIIVGAMTRSGGKWLCNLLANHSQISTLQSESHDGVLETNFFGRIQRATGDLHDPENYVALIELWSQSDLFKVAGVEKEFFYTLRPRPTNYLELFSKLRAMVAEREGKRYWLQKTSAVNADHYLPALPGSKVILTRRDLEGRLASVLERRKGGSAQVAVAKTAAGYVVQNKLLKRIARQYNCERTEYAALKANAEAELRRLCAYLELEYEPQMLEMKFAPNTSFKKGPRKPLSGFEKTIAHSVAGIMSAVPLPILMATRKLGENTEERFVKGTFHEIRQKYEIN